jgi:hypothetical protein
VIRRQRRAESLDPDDEPDMIDSSSIPAEKLLLQNRPQTGTHPLVRTDVSKGFASEVVNEEHDIGYVCEGQTFPVL